MKKMKNLEKLEREVIKLLGFDEDGTVHCKKVTGGLVLYYIGAGRNGWHERMAHVFYLADTDNLLKYLDSVRISCRLNEKTITRKDLIKVVVEYDEETLGDPAVEEDKLRIPFYLYHKDLRSWNGLNAPKKYLLKHNILVYNLNRPKKYSELRERFKF